MTKEQVQNNRELIAALRSGKYKQRFGKLKTRNGLCCLGVACDLFKNRIGIPWVGRLFIDKALNLPHCVKNSLGLDSQDGPILNIGNIYNRASQHNDRGRTFAEIADAWEKWLNEQDI